MKKPTFWEGVFIALLASTAGAVGYFALTVIFPEAFAIRLMFCGLAFAYGVYLLSRSRERIGRILVLLAWSILSAAVWLFDPALTSFLMVQLLSIWLVRSLYFHSRLLSSLADLGLCLLGIATAAWVLLHTRSLFLAIWCFFLIQALFVAIPSGNKQTPAEMANLANTEAEFKRAYQAAEAAVRKLSTLN